MYPMQQYMNKARKTELVNITKLLSPKFANFTTRTEYRENL